MKISIVFRATPCLPFLPVAYVLLVDDSNARPLRTSYFVGGKRPGRRMASLSLTYTWHWPVPVSVVQDTKRVVHHWHGRPPAKMSPDNDSKQGLTGYVLQKSLPLCFQTDKFHKCLRSCDGREYKGPHELSYHHKRPRHTHTKREAIGVSQGLKYQIFI